MTSSKVRASHHISPLRYPGGKAKLANYFKVLVRHNKLLDGVYIEPFAGGAGIGLSLLLHGYVRRIILNDLSLPIYSFWKSLLYSTDQFIDAIETIDLSVEEWIRQRKIFKEEADCSSFRLGFATFFLNRTNRSGVLNGGMIGGHEQMSVYGLDARFNRSELAARVRRIARVGHSIEVLNLDASTVIRNIREISDNEKTLLYIDPPYYKKGRDLYYDYYKESDHSKLRDVISGCDRSIRWVLTYDNVPEIRLLYQSYECLSYDLSYSVRTGRTGKEVMFFSDNLQFRSAPSIEGMPLGDAA